MRLLVLGAGNMARNHVREFRAAGAEIVAVSDLRPDVLEAFAAEHAIPRTFATLEGALEWGAFDAITNVTPDAAHHPTSLAAIAAGKHVFCEKPLSTDYWRAIELAEAVEKAGLVGMVNLSYRNVPELQQAHELVRSGAVGNVRHVNAAYLQSWLLAKMWGDWRDDRSGLLWKLSRKHGSNGVLGDLGIHLADMAVFGADQPIVAVAGRLRAFRKDGRTSLRGYDLDANDSFSLSVLFANGAIGALQSTRWAAGHANSLQLGVYGDRGGVEFRHDLKGSSLKLCVGEDLDTATWRDIAAPRTPTTYETFVRAVVNGERAEPGFRYGAELQLVLDAAANSSATGSDTPASPLRSTPEVAEAG